MADKNNVIVQDQQFYSKPLQDKKNWDNQFLYILNQYLFAELYDSYGLGND